MNDHTSPSTVGGDQTTSGNAISADASVTVILAKGLLALAALGLLIWAWVNVADSEVEVEGGGNSIKLKRQEKLNATTLLQALEHPTNGPVVRAMLNEAGFYRLDDPSIDARAVEKLRKRGIMDVKDGGVAAQLEDTLQARLATVSSGTTTSLERNEALTAAIESIPSIRELRERSRSERAPFQAVSSKFEAGKPNPADQPPKFSVYITDPDLIGHVIVVSNPKLPSTKLVVFAKPLTTVRNAGSLVQMNTNQFKYLGLHAVDPSRFRGETSQVLVSTAGAAQCLEEPRLSQGNWHLDRQPVIKESGVTCP